MPYQVFSRFGGLSMLGLTLVIGVMGGSGQAIAQPQTTAEFSFYLRADLAKMVQQGKSDRVMQQAPRIVHLMRTPCGPGAMAKVSARTLSNFPVPPELGTRGRFDD